VKFTSSWVWEQLQPVSHRHYRPTGAETCLTPPGNLDERPSDLFTGGSLPKLRSPAPNLGPRRCYETATLYQLTSSAAQSALELQLRSANLAMITVRSLTAEALPTVALV
jgi:hypothetical protein